MYDQSLVCQRVTYQSASSEKLQRGLAFPGCVSIHPRSKSPVEGKNKQEESIHKKEYTRLERTGIDLYQ